MPKQGHDRSKLMAERALAGEGGLEPFLEHLEEVRGFDFSGYKRSALARHIRKRMTDIGTVDYEAYVDYLEANPREFAELFDTILIDVSGFFRDAEAWEFVAKEIVPQLIETVPDEEPIRVWSAGCASGEEAYTAAIVLLEALGEDGFKRRVKVFATDVDEEALGEARAAVYSPQALAEMPGELVERYFLENGRGFAFRPDLRRSVIFGRNELLQDAPISRVDLLVCRNVLMYFTAEAQARILSQLNFALRDRGFLFLGKSQMLVRHSRYFTPVDVKWRVFKRIPRRNHGERFGEAPGAAPAGGVLARGHADLREAAASIGPLARLVVDASRLLVDVNDSARELFSIGPAEVGRPLQDLELSYRLLELRASLDRAFEAGEGVSAGRVEWGQPGKERIYEVKVTPIALGAELPSGAAITFADITDYAKLAAEHGRSKRELETAYEELQSAVEELQSTNEELQSTNEELASTKDELEAMNEEQRAHSEEVDRLNLFLDGILGNLGVAVAVVDREFTIQLWNARSEDLWGLRADEVDGEDFFSLDIGLPLADLRGLLENAVGSATERSDVTVEAINRRGRAFACEVRVMPLLSGERGLFGGIVLMRETDEDSVSI